MALPELWLFTCTSGSDGIHLAQSFPRRWDCTPPFSATPSLSCQCWGVGFDMFPYCQAGAKQVSGNCAAILPMLTPASSTIGSQHYMWLQSHTVESGWYIGQKALHATISFVVRSFVSHSPATHLANSQYFLQITLATKIGFNTTYGWPSLPKMER